MSLPCGDVTSGLCDEYLSKRDIILIPILAAVGVVYMLAAGFFFYKRWKRWRGSIGKYELKSSDVNKCADDNYLRQPPKESSSPKKQHIQPRESVSLPPDFSKLADNHEFLDAVSLRERNRKSMGDWVQERDVDITF